MQPPPPDVALADPNVAALAERFGVPERRIRLDPPPGTATAADVTALAERDKLFYDLLDGTLIEQARTAETARVAMRVMIELANWNDDRFGWAFGPGAFCHLPEGGHAGDRMRAPMASFVSDAQRPDGLAARGYSAGAPALCVEVFSPSNTRPEMARKRREYFENGCRLCWTIYPSDETQPAACEVHTPATGPDEGAGALLTETDDLTGGDVLPGLSIPFAKTLRRGA